MSVAIDKVYRLRSSVALVNIEDKLEMFKTNIREALVIKIEYKDITDLLLLFDGIKTSKQILNEALIFESSDFYALVSFLNDNYILIEMDQDYPSEILGHNYRTINLLEEFCKKTSEVLECLDTISRKQVTIIGLGAVGTWVADTLARSGVRNFILVDDDTVDQTNLHRQDFFFEKDINKLKIDCVEEFLKDISDIQVTKICKKLDDIFLDTHQLNSDLIINCADYPSVDYTSKIIGKYCMSKGIPHLIGGGYNLHLSLIGQTVIPGKTACVKCFEKHLDKINTADLDGVKKLSRPNRKIGSFGPVCALSASLTSTEAFKVLINKFQFLTNTNKRIEFKITEQDFSIQDVPRNPDCEWCGTSGIFA